MKKVLFVMLAVALFCTGAMVFAAGEQEGASGAAGDFTIGVSNSWYGNSWRESMMDSIAEVAAYYKGRGMIKGIITQQSGGDVQLQIQQIRNMINQGVDMIVINPASATGLTGVIEEAGDVGIPCIVMDAELLGDDRELALSVATDKFVEAYEAGKYVAEAIGGKGKVVILLGNPGAQPDMLRQEGFDAVLAEYPGLELLTIVYGAWNQSTAEATMNDVVATYPDIDAVFTIGSMGMGAARAFMNAGLDLPIMNGDPTVEWLRRSVEYLEANPDWKFAAPTNPPGIGATAFSIGVYQLNGYELKDELVNNNVFYYGLKNDHINNENLDEFLEMYSTADESEWITEWADDDTVRSYFK
jgi:ribose transport system substrate-binding protein